MVELSDIVRDATADDLKLRHSAFAELVSRFQDMAFGCAYGILGDVHLAQDISQESFLVVYRDLDGLRNPGAFPGWFKQIVIRKSYRYRNLESVTVSAADPGLKVASKEPDSQQSLIDAETARVVRLAVSELPEHERIVTVLFYLTGYSQQRISDFLDLPLTTIKKRLQRSRERLKGRIGVVEKTLTPDVTSFQDRNGTAMHAAAAWGRLEVAKFLLGQGMDVNVRSASGQEFAPLHRAAAAGRAELVSWLLANGADPSLRRKDGKTALDIAEERGHDEVVRSLAD